MSIVFKTFRTYAHPYVYDRHTNAVVMLTENEYEELVSVEEGVIAEEDSAVIRYYQEQGLFQPNIVEKIEHYATNVLEVFLTTHMKQLTLQVTQQCNLRCEYCVYSGAYEKNRTHSNAKMNFETAKKAIDFFLERNNELSEVIIGFYGGEPLLELELIKKCIDYARDKAEGKTISFNMTTNGTLLKEGVVDYLVENDVRIAISLDGAKTEHDRNRKFKDGTGSFDVIMENIARIRERYPDYEKKIVFLTTVNPHMNLQCVLNYFNTQEIFSDKNIMFSQMNETNVKDSLEYDKEFYRVRNYEYVKCILSLIGRIDKKYVSPLAASSRRSIMNYYDSIRKHTSLAKSIHPHGPCLPGVRRLFVRYDGKLFPCERVNEMQEYFCIGSLETGVDVNKARKIMNIGKVTEKLCKECWALRHCTLCSAEIEFESEPKLSDKVAHCSGIKHNALMNLHEVCVLHEFGLNSSR